MATGTSIPDDGTRHTVRVPKGLSVPGVAMLALAIAEALIRLLGVPGYILPPPSRIVATLVGEAAFLFFNAAITALEIGLGLVAGAALGVVTALAMAFSRRLMQLLRPVLIVSQALPVFAIAPLLVIWFGFGLGSKVVMAALIIYFPVATAFLDGLRRTDEGLLDLVKLYGAGRLRTLTLMRLPFSLPYLGSGLRVGATVAPVGAIVGEWVGASAGLGFVMLHANARMQTDVMFAALALLFALALVVRFTVDALCRRLTPWQTET